MRYRAPIFKCGMFCYFSRVGLCPIRSLPLQVTWTHGGRWIQSERRRLQSTRSLNWDTCQSRTTSAQWLGTRFVLTHMSLTETCQSGRAATNEKKDCLFPSLIRQNTFKSLFFRNGARDYVDQWKKRIPFSLPNKTKTVSEAPCDALNAPQFKLIEMRRIKCCIKWNRVH